MAANSQLYDTISEIVRDYHANQFEILTFSRIDVQDEIENHFGLETQCDKHGNVIDVLQFSDGAGYGLWLQKFTFPTHYSMEEHLKEAMCNVLFFDGGREEFLFHPRTQIRISSTLNGCIQTQAGNFILFGPSGSNFRLLAQTVD